VAVLKRNHKDLLAWQESVKLAVLVYRATEAFPRSEIYGLTSQIRRAATSIPANIAEGAGRTGTPELLRFLSIASGSLSELDSHFEIAYQLGYIKNREEIEEKTGRVFRLLTGLQAALKRKARD
jgi:four helix bundle protein